MEDKDFKELIKRMRFAQKEYFRTRSKNALQKSKDLEKEVDRELNRQMTLF